MKKILALLLCLFSLPAIAADNALIVTVGSGLTMRSIDIGGGVQSSGVNLVGAAGLTILGTAGTSNAQVLSVQGIASGTAMPVSLASTTITGTIAATQSGTWTVQPGNTANTTPWLFSPSTGGNTAAVKAASTAPGATDPALVVAISPNSVNANGSATSANSAPVVIASDQVAVAIKAASGVFASGSFASGSHASGSFASGAFASGSVASGAVASGAYASGSLASGAMVDLTNLSTPITPATATATKAILLGGQYNSTIPTFTNGQQGSLQIASNGALRGIQTGPYPDTAVPYTASATGTTGATTATLAGAANVTTYICGFSIRANATAAVTGNATVTGTITGTLNFTQWTAPTASGLGITEMIFTPCVPASAANTSIAVVSAAPGTGGVVSSTAWGYKL